jgi:hypothetical protein
MANIPWTTALVGAALALPLSCASVPRSAQAVSRGDGSAAQATASPTAPRAAVPVDADRPPAASTPSPPDASAPPLSAASAAAGLPGVHVVPLPRSRPGDDMGNFPRADMVEGRAPDERHPAGTVLVAETRSDRREPTSITEWDLATGRELREVPLWAGNEVRMVRAGDVLHAIVWVFERDVYYVCLQLSDFRVLNVERIGTLQADEAATIATDGRVTVVVAHGSLPNAAASFLLATFAPDGHRVAARSVQPSTSMQDNAVVVNGHPYVLLPADANAAVPRYRLLRLRGDLSTDREWSFHASGDADQLTLESWQQRLAVRDSHAPGPILFFSAEPREIGRSADCAEAMPLGFTDRDLVRQAWLGRVHVALYVRQPDGEAYLAWTEETEPGPRPPCWAARP